MTIHYTTPCHASTPLSMTQDSYSHPERSRRVLSPLLEPVPPKAGGLGGVYKSSSINPNQPHKELLFGEEEINVGYYCF
jgi:hypothetical protein